MIRTARMGAALLLCLTILCGCLGYPTVEDDGRELKTPDDAWDFYPGFKNQINAIGDVFYAYQGKHTILSQKSIELSALLTARYWHSEMSWSNHEHSARYAGISDDIIEAVRNWQHPDFGGDEELEIVYQFATEMLTTKNITDVTYMNLRNVLGKRANLELGTLISHECTIALTIKAFRLKPDTPVILPSGSWDVEQDFTEIRTPGRYYKLGDPFITSEVFQKNQHIYWAENIFGLTFPGQGKDRLHELSLLITGRYWNCLLPWSSHVQPARIAGIQREAIQKLGIFEDPTPYMADDEKILYEFAKMLFDHDLEMDEATYSKMVDVVGRPVLVKLVTAMGCYTEISVVANTLGNTGPASKRYPFPVE